MSKTLIVGCSYIENLDSKHCVGPEQVSPRFVLRGSSGAGNQSIAARVAYECSYNNYDRVIVLWSGIFRLDFPVGQPLHKTAPVRLRGKHKYEYFTEMGHTVWYHSGGWGLSGCSENSPEFFRNFCTAQYRGATPQYLSEMSLLSIMQTQCFLNQHNIPYDMSFIYDVNQNYTEPAVEPGCGKLYQESAYFNLVDWKKFTPAVAPYEFAKTIDDGFEPDGFHPKFNTMNKWFKTYLNEDLTS